MEIILVFFQNLYIQGKNLLNHEIKIAKELIGKKKRLIQYILYLKYFFYFLYFKYKLYIF